VKNARLKRRLERLETKSGIGADPQPLIIVSFVKPNGQFGGEPCEAARAEADGQVWKREPGETSQDFERHVIANVSKREHMPTLLIFFPAARSRS
jgi:hypothetical protein